MAKLPLILLGIILLAFTPLTFAENEESPVNLGEFELKMDESEECIGSCEIIVIETNSGKLVIEFFPDDAPNHVAQFTQFAEGRSGFNSNYYKDTFFHRIIPGFMIQGGDPHTRYDTDKPDTWGKGGPPQFLDQEFNDIKHNRGIVSMARAADPNSAGSQFFIVHQDSTFLDGQYTVFGRLATQESFETLDKIASLETDQKDRPIDLEASKIIKTSKMNRSDVPDLLNLNPPERLLGFTPPPKISYGETYIDEELGFSFSAPAGWLIQHPPQTNSDSPNVAAVGPELDGLPPAITVNVKDSFDSHGVTLKQHVEDLDKTLQPAITSGAIVVLGEVLTQHQGYEAYSLVVLQDFTLTESESSLIKINVYLIKTPQKLYTLQFSNLAKNFESTEEEFQNTLNSFNIEKGLNEFEQIEQTEAAEGGGCLIATAAYGSEMAPQVQFLREIRDNTVLQTQSGTSFMTAFNTFYYTFSPTIADYERENPIFKEAVKVGLTPLLTSLTILNYVDIDTEQEMLGYGIGIIMLNIGMYFVAPAVVVIALKNRRK